MGIENNACMGWVWKRTFANKPKAIIVKLQSEAIENLKVAFKSKGTKGSDWIVHSNSNFNGALEFLG
jgi:hypothetical protein